MAMVVVLGLAGCGSEETACEEFSEVFCPSVAANCDFLDYGYEASLAECQEYVAINCVAPERGGEQLIGSCIHESMAGCCGTGCTPSCFAFLPDLEATDCERLIRARCGYEKRCDITDDYDRCVELGVYYCDEADAQDIAVAVCERDWRIRECDEAVPPPSCEPGADVGP